MSGIVETVWRSGLPSQHAVTLRMSDGLKATVRLSDGMVTGADADVWAFPERYGFERYTCTGHDGHVCYYGACDGIRMAGGPPDLGDLAQPSPPDFPRTRARYWLPC